MKLGRILGLCLAALGLVSIASAQLKSTLYASGFSLPVAFIQDPTDPNRQFVVQQRGLIRCVVSGVVQGTSAINLSATVSNSGAEKGLLGMAFDPNYATNQTAYIYYTTGNTTSSTISWISKITRNAIDPKIFDAASLNPIFTLTQVAANHNGGNLVFGQDGYLYCGLGDGGGQGDPGDRAQNLSTLFGKILRIDPSVDAFPSDPNKDYAIPPGQPFSGAWGTLAPEVWALGVRNPWKWSFDRTNWLGTGGLWIGEVGQDTYEEIDFSPMNAAPRNYGWRRKEAYSFFDTTTGPNTSYQDPIWAYDHTEGVSITGGHVYRGTKLGDYFGRYFFADYGTSRIWTLKPNYHPTTGEALNAVPADITEHTTELAVPSNGVSSIDIDSNGELYYIDYGLGRVYRIDPLNRAWAVDYTLKQAVATDGQLRSLSATDGKFVSYFANFESDTIDGDAGILRAGFNHNRTTVTSLQVAVASKTNQPTGANGRIALRNWNTKRLDVIHNFSMTTAVQTFTSPSVASSNYVRAGDGRIEVAILGNAQLLLVDPVMTFVDMIKVSVN